MLDFMYISRMDYEKAIIGSDLDLLDDMRLHGEKIIGYFSTSDKKIGFPFLGDHSQIKNLPPDVKLVVAVDDPDFRRYMKNEFSNLLSGYISPLARISSSTKIKMNSVVYPHSYISAQVELGELVKISVGTQVHHECNVGDFSVIGPRSLVLGRVRIGQNTFIGAGTCISPNTFIGSDVTVGMGSNILKDVNDNTKVWGNPAKPQ